MKSRTWISALAVLALAATALAQVDGDIKKTFKVQPGGLLTVEADLGSIEVQTANQDEIKLEILFERRSGSSNRLKELLEDFDVSLDQTGNDLRVILEYKRDRHNFWDSVGRYLRVQIVATVPQRYNLDLATSGGSVEVADLEGRVRTRTSGGSLRFGQITGPVDGKTSGGSITLQGCKGDADVSTSGGSIHIGKVEGDVRAHTSGGGIEVEEVMGVIDAKTSGGGVTARLSKQPTDDCSLKTSGGSITVYLVSGAKVNVDAATSGGRVTTDFPVTIQGELSRRALRAEINGGGPELYLRTSGGSIHLKEI